MLTGSLPQDSQSTGSGIGGGSSNALAQKTAGLASAGKVFMANNCNIPYTHNTLTSWVHNAWTTHVAGPAGYTNMQMKFVNWVSSTNSETQASYDFTLRVGIYYNGNFYPAYFNGQRDVVVSKNFGEVVTDPLDIHIPAGASFYVTNRRVATDLGGAGSYNVLTSVGGLAQRQDGIIAGTDPTADYTLGVGLGFGAKLVNPPTIAGGTVTAITKDTNNLGIGYSAGLSVNYWYGPAGVGAPGALYPGSGLSGGFFSESHGQITTGSPGTGGSGYSAVTPVQVYVSGGGGFASVTASYGPSAIFGNPDVSTPSVILHGDSITAGYGSVDSTGDLHANYGLFEQTLNNQYGLIKLAVVGESVEGWNQNNTHQKAFIQDLVSRGVVITHVFMNLVVNDFISNLNSNVLTTVQGQVNTINTYWRSLGAKVYNNTVLPNNTTSSSSNKYTTVVEQTPLNVNYTLGSFVDQYNTTLLAGGVIANDGVVDLRSLAQDATVTTAWRVDTYGGATAFANPADGIHPSIGVGIPYFVANLILPTLTVS